MNKRLFAAMCLWGLVGGAFAQNEVDKEINLNQVVITGSGMHQRLKDATSPVEVINAKDLKQANVTDFQEAMTRFVPSLTFSNTSMGAYLTMNGLGNRYVLVMVNGKRLNGDISGNVDLTRIDMSNIKRIEVVQGASSSLYGSDAIAGVINIITNKPMDGVQVTSHTKVETYGQISQQFNVRANDGKLETQTSYNYVHSDGWQQSNREIYKGKEYGTNRHMQNPYHMNQFNQHFGYTFDRHLSIWAEGSFFNRKTERPGVKGLDEIAGLPAKEVYTYNLDYTGTSADLGARYKVDSHLYFTATTGVDRFESQYDYISPSGDYKIGDITRSKLQYCYYGKLKGYYHVNDMNRIIGGVDYQLDQLVSPTSNVDEQAYQLGVYAQDEWTICDDLTATMGARYTTHKEAGQNFSPKIAVKYQLGDVNFRVNYSTGFRAPDLMQLYYVRPARGTVTLGNTDMDPERSQYASFNVEYTNHYINASASAYINAVDDMILYETTNLSDYSAEEQAQILDKVTEAAGPDEAATITKVRQYLNLDKALVRGFELNLDTYLTNDLSLGAHYSYAYGQQKSQGKWGTLIRAVRHSGTWYANYGHTWGIYRLNVNLTGSAQSKRYHETSGEDVSAPGFAMWNLATKHRFNLRNFAVTPSVGINNIFDYKDDRAYDSEIVNYSTLNPGRTLFVGLTLEFTK